jgi:hypothetical protein
MSPSVCPWCHTEVEEPCASVLECKTCPEPYTLTDEQAARVREITAGREPLRAKPLPIEDRR